MSEDYLIDWVDPGSGQNLDAVPMWDGGVEFRLFGKGKRTTTRSVIVPPDVMLDFVMEAMSHLREHRDQLKAAIADDL